VPFDVIVLGFVLPLIILVVAAALAMAAKKRWMRWTWIGVAAFSVVWMAGSLFAFVVCC
jgi:hypothetical protein